MTNEQYTAISDLNIGIMTAKRLLSEDIKVKCVKRMGEGHIYEAGGFYQINREFGEKVSKVLENAAREIHSMLNAELARLEAEFAGIIIGTELKPSDHE